MNFKTRIVGMLLVGAVALSACAAPAPTAMPDKAMAKPTPTTEAMKKELPTAETAMAKPTDSQMMEKTAATPDAMKKELPTAEAAMAKPTARAAMPAWFAAQLTDVTTGKTFMLGDLKGKVVLVETMAIWCPTCLRQQGEVQALHKAQGVRRLVCLTGAMVDDYPHLSWFMRAMRNSYRKQQPALAVDRAEQERLVAASGLAWTAVKPPRLTNGAARGRVRSGESLKVGAFSSISRADLARFMLDEVESPQYMGKRVVVQS